MTARDSLRTSWASIREKLGFPANRPEAQLAPGLGLEDRMPAAPHTGFPRALNALSAFHDALE